MVKPPRKLKRKRKLAIVADSMLSPSDMSVSAEDFLAHCREYHSSLRTNLLNSRTQVSGGRGFVEAYSRIVDELVGIVFERASRESGMKPPATGIAVIAMGGYGRSELAPFSDVDILILCKRKTPGVKKIAGQFIRLMWDVGFELGHSVQSLVESRYALARNMDMRTALIEGRWLCGSRDIGRAVKGQLLRPGRRDSVTFLQRKIKDALQRHARYGKSYQLVEPNVKLSPGGMRDFQTLNWLGMIATKRIETGLRALKRLGLLLPGEIRELEAAYDFLIRVRVELHLATRSKQDQLTVQMQRIITERLGYGSKGDHLGVELFMKDYYMHTRTIFRIVEDTIDELERGRRVQVLLGGVKPEQDGYALSARISRDKLGKNPLYIFYMQKERGMKLSRSLKRKLELTLKERLAKGIDTRRMRLSFPDLLKDGRNVSLVLRSMHETGFLGRIVPEYEHLTCLKRYDLYHHYTADEHSFRVVRNLELLSDSGTSKLSGLARIYSEIADKQMLFLAALLHDIGKIEGRGHARKGALLSQRILKRLGLEENQGSFVGFLIEHHLLMSHFSQRRDPTDMGTIRSFCSRVRSRNNLKFLTLLTYADLKATSPLVWTKWKDNLLWRLYNVANQFMAKKEKKPDAVYKARKRSILRAFARGDERREALAHLDLLPGRYLLTMSPSQVKRHIMLIDELDGAKAAVDLRKRRVSTEVTFCTFDKPFRLSQLCGILAVNDLNILYAYAFTRKDGKVIDVFHVEKIAGADQLNERALGKIRSDVISVLEGKVDINEEFEKHIARWKRRKITAIPVSVRVEVENDLSSDFTIVDIFAQDGPGLLYKITRALSELGLVIFRARISTEANRAIDAFYVQDKNGRKIKSAKRISRIRKGLEKALG